MQETTFLFNLAFGKKYDLDMISWDSLREIKLKAVTLYNKVH